MALERIKALVRGTLDIKRLEKNGFVHGKNLNTQLVAMYLLVQELRCYQALQLEII